VGVASVLTLIVAVLAMIWVPKTISE